MINCLPEVRKRVLEISWLFEERAEERYIEIENLHKFSYYCFMAHFRDAEAEARLLEPRDVLGGEAGGGIDERVARLMGALSSATRVRTLFALLEDGEVRAGELAKRVGMSDSATSHQLRVLRDLGLVKRRREGRSNYYSLADGHLEVLLEESLYHVDHARLEEKRRP